MRILSGKEKDIAENYISEAAAVALNAKCLKHRRGAVIVNNGEIIGEGWNSPPMDEPVSRCLKDDLPDDFDSDMTCCVHAEQNAYIDALKKKPNGVNGATIYYAIIDECGKQMISGEPCCTICSKLGLEIGIREFVYMKKEGVCSYYMKEFNEASFGFAK
jgi:deoxycytidylate deaminase